MRSWFLPRKVSKCLICFCHSVSGFFLGDGGSFAFVRGEDFGEQRFMHRLALTPLCYTKGQIINIAARMKHANDINKIAVLNIKNKIRETMK